MSLRLPAETETMIADFGARHGLSKTAVIVRSIQEFLATHAQPSSLQVYEQAMRGITAPLPGNPASDSAREAAEKRPRKLAFRDAIRRKHAIRSARAAKTVRKQAATPRRGSRKQA